MSLNRKEQTEATVKLRLRIERLVIAGWDRRSISESLDMDTSTLRYHLEKMGLLDSTRKNRRRGL